MRSNRDELSAVTKESAVELSKAKFSKSKITGLLKVIGDDNQVTGAAPVAARYFRQRCPLKREPVQ